CSVTSASSPTGSRRATATPCSKKFSTATPSGSSASSPAPDAGSGGHDGAARDVAVLLLPKRFVDLLQREPSGDDLVVRIPLARGGHQVERALQMLGLVVHRAEETPVAEDEPRRIDRRLPARVDVADVDVRALGRDHAQAFVDHVRVTD